MRKRQREIIYKLQEKKENNISLEQPYDILIHSVLNTIEFIDLVYSYITEEISQIRVSIFSNIEKRVIDYNNPERLYEDLKFKLENETKYIESQRIRKVLELLLLRLNKSYKEDFFNTFFYSKYSNDRKIALNYADYSKKTINNLLLSEYMNTGNFKFLNPLLLEKESEFLAAHIKSIWNERLPFYYKKKIIELISEKHPGSFKFLENKEYDLYLLTLLLNKKIKPEEVILDLEKVKKDKRHFTIFNISKFVKFEMIEEEIKKYII